MYADEVNNSINQKQTSSGGFLKLLDLLFTLGVIGMVVYALVCIVFGY